MQAHDGILQSAFPGIKGKILNMRDIEQGLDQLNRLVSSNAKSEMLPGEDDGSTIVNVSNQPDKRWQATLSRDTLGQASTGYAHYNAGLTRDNIPGVNDQWNRGISAPTGITGMVILLMVTATAIQEA